MSLFFVETKVELLRK